MYPTSMHMPQIIGQLVDSATMELNWSLFSSLRDRGGTEDGTDENCQDEEFREKYDSWVKAHRERLGGY
jgi:hypothetical protein